MAENEKKVKSKGRKIIEWILFGIFGVATAFLLAANVSGMIHKKENYGQSIRFGVGTFVILTDSMEPEIHKDDLIITYKEDVSKFSTLLEQGKTIDVTFANVDVNVPNFELDTEAFRTGSRVVSNEVMTHRLREVHINVEKNVGEGHYIFVASGINDQGYESRKGQYQVFTEKEYLGTVRSSNKALGRFMNFLSSAWGLIILLLIPGAYLIVVSSMDIYKAVKESENDEPISANNKSEVGGDHLSKISDKDRERLKNELLEEMLKEKKEGKK